MEELGVCACLDFQIAMDQWLLYTSHFLLLVEKWLSYWWVGGTKLASLAYRHLIQGMLYLRNYIWRFSFRLKHNYDEPGPVVISETWEGSRESLYVFCIWEKCRYFEANGHMLVALKHIHKFFDFSHRNWNLILQPLDLSLLDGSLNRVWTLCF